jgi:hypothetical protein
MVSRTRRFADVRARVRAFVWVWFTDLVRRSPGFIRTRRRGDEARQMPPRDLQRCLAAGDLGPQFGAFQRGDHRVCQLLGVRWSWLFEVCGRGAAAARPTAAWLVAT